MTSRSQVVDLQQSHTKCFYSSRLCCQAAADRKASSAAKGASNTMAVDLKRLRDELEGEIVERRRAEERVLRLNAVSRAIRNGT